MTVNIEFSRPQSLDIGKTYLFRDRDSDGGRQSVSAVTFVNYTPCPAIVIIKFAHNEYHRCLREDLFELEFAEKYQVLWIELISILRRYKALLRV